MTPSAEAPYPRRVADTHRPSLSDAPDRGAGLAARRRAEGIKGQDHVRELEDLAGWLELDLALPPAR
jgi:hypothetical protein